MKPGPTSRRFLIGALLCVCLSGYAGSSKQSSSAGNPGPIQADQTTVPASSVRTVAGIPGPLQSFLRMAGVSQQIQPEDVIPQFTHNVVVDGYRDGHPTEFLLLLNRYVLQARQLQKLAGSEGVIRVSTCADARPLLDILGYRLRGGCGRNAYVETADANRAFLTINSGFPLAAFEQSVREGKPFVIPYKTTEVPLLFTPDTWIVISKHHPRNLVDAFIRNPEVARLYWAMSRLDRETALSLRQSLGLRELVRLSPVLDFFGSHITIQGGRVILPGGPAAEPIWESLVHANPASPGNFVQKLLERDDGWLAAYFDTLSYADGKRRAYFTAPNHLRRFYEALRGKSLSPNPTHHSFRPDEGLFLLVNRLQFDSNGHVLVPGSLGVWRKVLEQKTDSRIVHDVSKRASGWKTPDDLVDGMVRLSRDPRLRSPLEAYLALSEIDARRLAGQRLDPRTALLLAEKFPRLGDQYVIFSEFHELNNVSIRRFIAVAESVTRMKNRVLRSDVLGTFEANVGLWQILARQGEIPPAAQNASWQRVVNPFAAIRTSAQLYDSARSSLEALLRAAAGKSNLSEDEMIALLAGPRQTTAEGQRVRRQLANRVRAVMRDQRLVSLDTIFALGNALVEMGNGVPIPEELIQRAKELQEFEMPRPLFTKRERLQYAPGLINNYHTATEMRTNLVKSIKAASTSKQAANVRGELTPFLRDTLVGLNYAYYEPPGAQMLHNNPLFVRSHDFSGGDFSGQTTLGEEIWTAPRLFGQGWTAGGGAHLVGSLADLPTVLAEVEEDFIVPKNVQSLIWEEMVPALVTSAIVPRWWGISRTELHAVALYQKAGEELLAAAAHNPPLRRNVIEILADRMLPRRLELVEDALRKEEFETALRHTVPADAFYLTAEFRKRFPRHTNDWGPAGQELGRLAVLHPEETNFARLSRDFGVPHPTLARNNGRELLNFKPIPTFMNYSSRLLAESWESNNLYFARLADERNYPPVTLNLLIPQLTERMVEETFATNLQDWPALLRAMRETGDQFREGKVAALPKQTGQPGL